MASIAAQQTAIAAALATATGFNVRTLPVTQPKAADGWVNVGRVEPGGTLTAADCTFTGVLVLGSDARQAAQQIAVLSVPILTALTTGPTLHPEGVSIEPAELPAGDVSPGSIYALIVNLTVEVDS